MARVTSMYGFLFVALATPLAAQRAPAPVQPRHLGALEACRAIAADSARLACFDREAAALLTASRSGDLTVVDRADLRTARRSLFGFSLPKLPFFSNDKSAEDTPDTLESTIVTAQGLANGRYRMTIATGDAVWETSESRLTLNEPRAGQKIVISKGALGSYFLRINGQVGVKGRRVK